MTTLKGTKGPLVALMVFFSSSAFAGTITVTSSEQLRNSNGTLRCALWTQDMGFPGKVENAAKVVSAAIRSNTAVCSFSDVNAGKYAISILHDENDNKEIDVASYGPPLEGYGTSNNAEPLPTSPPTFEGAVFEYDGSATKLVLEMRYPVQGAGGPPGQ